MLNQTGTRVVSGLDKNEVQNGVQNTKKGYEMAGNKNAPASLEASKGAAQSEGNGSSVACHQQGGGEFAPPLPKWWQDKKRSACIEISKMRVMLGYPGGKKWRDRT